MTDRSQFQGNESPPRSNVGGNTTQITTATPDSGIRGSKSTMPDTRSKGTLTAQEKKKLQQYMERVNDPHAAPLAAQHQKPLIDHLWYKKSERYDGQNIVGNEPEVETRLAHKYTPEDFTHRLPAIGVGQSTPTQFEQSDVVAQDWKHVFHDLSITGKGKTVTTATGESATLKDVTSRIHPASDLKPSDLGGGWDAAVHSTEAGGTSNVKMATKVPVFVVHPASDLHSVITAPAATAATAAPAPVLEAEEGAKPSAFARLKDFVGFGRRRSSESAVPPSFGYGAQPDTEPRSRRNSGSSLPILATANRPSSATSSPTLSASSPPTAAPLHLLKDPLGFGRTVDPSMGAPGTMPLSPTATGGKSITESSQITTETRSVSPPPSMGKRVVDNVKNFFRRASFSIPRPASDHHDTTSSAVNPPIDASDK